MRPTSILMFWSVAVGAAGCAGGIATLNRSDGPPITAWEALYPEVVDPTRSTDGPRGYFRARGPSAEQAAALEAALADYIADDDEKFAAQRDQLAADPITAFWLTRTLVLFVVKARDAAPAHAGLMVGEPVWARPTRHIEALGAAAVPAIVIDLVRHERSYCVDLGGDLLESIGAPGFPRWAGALALDDAGARRRLVEVIGAWQERDAVMVEALSTAARDRDFGVRAAAYSGLATMPERWPQVIDALETDSDPFVQREIAKALGRHRGSREAAAAIIEYLQRCTTASDRRGMAAADEALRAMSGRRQGTTLDGWRSWLSTIR